MERGGDRADLVYLDPLDADAIAQVVRNHAPVDLPPADEQRIIESAQGNPCSPNNCWPRWRTETDAIPASLRGLLAARIDRLGPGERDLLRAAAVAGDHLSSEALQVLAPTRHVRSWRGTWSRSLGSDCFDTPSRRAWSFRTDSSVMPPIRASPGGTGYASISPSLNGLRTPRCPRDELDAVVGHHLEQAVINRRHVGLPGDGALEARAGAKLASAASRAYARFDMSAASNLLARALDMLPDGHPLVPTATQRLAEVSLPVGEHPGLRDSCCN